MKRKPVKYTQGIYVPKYKSKYKGDINNIVYRSSYELQFMNYCDSNSTILEWSSEETIVPYIKPTDGRVHRYYLDFWIKYKSNTAMKGNDYWDEVFECDYNTEQVEQIRLIKEDCHPSITAIRDIKSRPDEYTGKINDIYISSTTNNMFIKKRGKDIFDKLGNPIYETKKAIIEIKPYSQTIAPKTPKRKTNSYIQKCVTFAINSAKWDSAREFALKNNMEFMIITEKWLKNIK